MPTSSKPTHQPHSDAYSADIVACRAGVVSYLNAMPLREGLAHEPGWTLTPAVPAALGDLLDAGEIDIALLPVVDVWRRRDAVVPISDGCIASDGETLTVRVFSRVPAERVTTLHVDADSHTSVMLARLVWRRMYGTSLELVATDMRRAEIDARCAAALLIGDKVVTRRPLGFGFEVDLGAAWKHLTGLPMVFAQWVARKDAFDDAAFERVATTLCAARDRGVATAAAIAAREAPGHGWPVALATHYLTTSLQYRLDARMRAGLARFVEGIGERI
jgi:chorismate dehydratase